MAKVKYPFQKMLKNFGLISINLDNFQASGTSLPSQPDVSATPFGLGSLGGLAGVGNIGMGSANFMEMQQRMQREVFILISVLQIRRPYRDNLGIIGHISQGKHYVVTPH